jgi:DNA-binding LacI/PurR family transcriptional regulator
VRALVDLRVDALVVVGTMPDNPDLALASRSVPTVVAGSREPVLPRVDIVANDDEAGVRLAMAHLLELGHRRVAHLVGAGRVGALRREAYEQSLREAGGLAVTAHSGMTEAGGHAATLELLRTGPRPTALLAANDLTAVGALAAAAELGLRVPEDLSVVGYDDTSLARLRHVSLTSVDNASRAVGEHAGRRVLHRLAGADGEAETVLLLPALVVRGTTAPPRP